MSDSNYNHSNRKPVVENVQSPLTLKTHSTAVDYLTAGESAILVTDTSAPRTITIATADLVAGRQIEVTDASGLASVNNITVQGQAGELINGQATLVIESDYGCTTLVCDGSAWFTAGGGGGAPVPVQRDGVEVVAAPTALNFKNAIVEDNAGVADIDFPNAALGGYQEVLPFVASVGAETATNSYADISGMVEQTFVTPVSGEHVFTLTNQDWAYGGGGASVLFRIQLLIDGVPYEYPPLESATTGGTLTQTYSVIATLAAGPHTIKPQWKRISGCDIYAGSDYPWSLLIQAQGTGINGLEVQESTLASNFTVTQAFSDIPGGDTAQVDSVECVVSTLEGERVQVSYEGSVYLADLDGLVMGYQVDSGTPVCTHYASTFGAEVNENSAHFSVFTQPLSAGQHTIRLMAAKTGGAPVFAGVNNSSVSTFQVTRHKSDGIGAGSVTATDTLVGDTTITTRHPTLMDTGLQVLVNTVTNETVLLNFSGYAAAASGLSSGIFLYYQVDGDPEVLLTVDSTEQIPTTEKNISASASVLIAAAGAHTIKLRAGTTLVDWVIHAEAAKLSVTQYRGGQIPFKNNGALVENTPVDIDFGPEFELTSTAKSVSVRTAPGFMRVVQPSEGGAGIVAAMNAAHAAGGGIVQLLTGTYVIDAGMLPTWGLSNVTLRGTGPGTVLSYTGADGSYILALGSNYTWDTYYKPVAVPARGDTSVFTLTAADAAFYTAGMDVMVRGVGSFAVTEACNARVKTNGNPSTGEIELMAPVTGDFVSDTFMTGTTGGDSVRVEDLKISDDSGGVGNWGIFAAGTKNCVFSGLELTKMRNAIHLDYAVYTYYGFRNTIRGCNVHDVTGEAYGVNSQIEALVEHNYANGCATGIGQWMGLFDCRFLNNTIENFSGTFGIQANGYDAGRRLTISGNTLCNGWGYGIIVTATIGCVVSGNKLTNCGAVASGAAALFVGGHQLIVSQNTVLESPWVGMDVVGTRVVVEGNMIINTIPLGYTEIFYVGADDATVSGNLVQGSSVGGLLAAGANMTAMNNVAENNTGYNIFIQAAGGCMIGNTGRNGGPVTFYGSTDCAIIGNNANGAGFYPGGAGCDHVANKA